MEDEAIRVIKRGPKWTPAIQNGRNVNAYRKQPITFVVQSVTNKLLNYKIPPNGGIFFARNVLNPSNFET